MAHYPGHDESREEEQQAQEDIPLSNRDRIAETFRPPVTEAEGSAFAWEQRIDAAVLSELYGWANQNLVSLDAIDQLYSNLLEGLILDIRFGLFPEGDAVRASMTGGMTGVVNDRTASAVQAALGQTLVGMGRLWYTQTLDGFEAMMQRARAFIGANTPIDLGSVRPTGSTGSRGSRGPTAQEIRNSFDLKNLAELVNQMNRGLVLEDHKDATKLARQYVDAIVKTKGEVKIDFETFVRERITATSRFKSIYRNKPEALEPEEYLAPYLIAARGLARPNDADQLAIAGAQAGATGEQFTSRLAREDVVTGSAPFINALGSRLRALNNVFKG